MKCKAERPWLLCANLWGPFSLSLFLGWWFLSFISVSPSQRDAFLPWYHSLPPSTSDSSPLCLGDNDLPLFCCKSWTLHFSNVQDLIRTGFFYFLGNSSGDKTHAFLSVWVASCTQHRFNGCSFPTLMLTSQVLCWLNSSATIHLNQDTASVT